MAVVVVALAGGGARAQQWGARSTSTISDIHAGGGQTNPTFDIVGGAGIPAASSSIDDAVTLDSKNTGPWGRGTTEGATALTFGGNQPNPMAAGAFLTGNRSPHERLGVPPAGAVASTSVFVSDLFQYTGTTPTTLTLTYQMEGMLDDPAGDTVANGLTRIYAEVAVFADTPDYVFFPDTATLLLELMASLKQSGGVDAIDRTALLIEDDTGGATAVRQTTLAFDVTPGETFYVWQAMLARAALGTRSADALSTLTASFSEPDLVTSLSLPEPGTLTMLLAGGWVLLRRSG